MSKTVRLPFFVACAVMLAVLAVLVGTLAAAKLIPVWLAIVAPGVLVIGWSIQVYRLHRAAREMEKLLGVDEQPATVEIEWYSSRQSLIACSIAILLMVAVAVWYFGMHGRR